MADLDSGWSASASSAQTTTAPPLEVRAVPKSVRLNVGSGDAEGLTESAALSDVARLGRPISWDEARRLALGAREKAEQRWKEAAEAEARYFKEVLGPLPAEAEE